MPASRRRADAQPRRTPVPDLRSVRTDGGCQRRGSTDAGCAVIISHDRLFSNRIATHIQSVKGDAYVKWSEGNCADDLEDKKHLLGVEELVPHRMKHWKFAR